MITLFLLSLVIKLTGVIMIYGFKITYEIIAFILAFLFYFIAGFIQVAATEYKRIKTA